MLPGSAQTIARSTASSAAQSASNESPLSRVHCADDAGAERAVPCIQCTSMRTAASTRADQSGWLCSASMHPFAAAACTKGKAEAAQQEDRRGNASRADDEVSATPVCLVASLAGWHVLPCRCAATDGESLEE